MIDGHAVMKDTIVSSLAPLLPFIYSADLVVVSPPSVVWILGGRQDHHLRPQRRQEARQHQEAAQKVRPRGRESEPRAPPSDSKLTLPVAPSVLHGLQGRRRRLPVRFVPSLVPRPLQWLHRGRARRHDVRRSPSPFLLLSLTALLLQVLVLCSAPGRTAGNALLVSHSADPPFPCSALRAIARRKRVEDFSSGPFRSSSFRLGSRLRLSLRSCQTCTNSFCEDCLPPYAGSPLVSLLVLR
jgi:hypothetical protein